MDRLAKCESEQTGKQQHKAGRPWPNFAPAQNLAPLLDEWVDMQPCSLLELDDRRCRWPLEDPALGLVLRRRGGAALSLLRTSSADGIEKLMAGKIRELSDFQVSMIFIGELMQAQAAASQTRLVWAKTQQDRERIVREVRLWIGEARPRQRR